MEIIYYANKDSYLTGFSCYKENLVGTNHFVLSMAEKRLAEFGWYKYRIKE